MICVYKCSLCRKVLGLLFNQIKLCILSIPYISRIMCWPTKNFSYLLLIVRDMRCEISSKVSAQVLIVRLMLDIRICQHQKNVCWLVLALMMSETRACLKSEWMKKTPEEFTIRNVFVNERIYLMFSKTKTELQLIEKFGDS